MTTTVRTIDAIAVIEITDGTSVADALPDAVEEALVQEPQHLFLDLTRSSVGLDGAVAELIHAQASADCAGARFTVVTAVADGGRVQGIPELAQRLTVSEGWDDAFERVGPAPVSRVQG